MSRDKQFDEHLDLTDTIHMSGYGLLWEDCTDIAHQIQDQGYRKSSDLAEEIFAEIEKAFTVKYPMCTNPVLVLDSLTFAELKKKYIGEDTNVRTKESEKDNGKM